MARGGTACVDCTSPVSVRIVERTRQLAQHLLDPYRPELHYMRGPGPKWREKHGQAPAPDIGQFSLSDIQKAGA